MVLLIHELRLFLRQRVARPALVLMALLSSAAVWAGMAEVSRQRDVIARIQPEQERDVAAVRAWVSKEGEAGNAAYYTFHATWDDPSRLAFAALGQRDVAPYVLRVRALALESQIHESENYNAEMALPGRFDWAFVLTYLAPLFLIVLLHDLQSGEREAGRIGLLRVMASGKRWLWLRRIGLRVGLLFTALVLPFTAGALLSGTSWTDLFALSGLALLYLLFWAGVSWLIERRGMGSVANAAALAASWLTLTLILPTLALLAINGAFPVRQGVELTLAQREAVHSGWDKPKAATLEAFSRHYPEWRNTKPVESGFHWKWYFSFHHLGDLAVSDQVRTYREGLEARDRWTRRLGVVLPAVGVQVITHHMALTDLAAQLSYQDRIRIYHEHLRRFYYPYIFNDTRFSETDFGKAPKWKPAS
jgi:ABC-2 type transport system permease protein